MLYIHKIHVLEYDLPTSVENRYASFRVICLQTSKITIIRHHSIFKKNIHFQNTPTEYKVFIILI
jgi:hypothetical protein